ncbi:MAG: hypothetical protein ACK52I_28010, partial [Pseudomonadota bacterium]
QIYSNCQSYSIFCPNQIKSLLILRQKNLLSSLTLSVIKDDAFAPHNLKIIGGSRATNLKNALNHFLSNKYWNIQKVDITRHPKEILSPIGISRNAQVLINPKGQTNPIYFEIRKNDINNSSNNLNQLLDKKIKSGTKKNKFYPPCGLFFLKEKRIRYNAFQISQSLIFYIFLLLFTRFVYKLFFKIALSKPDTGLLIMGIAHKCVNIKKKDRIGQTNLISLLTNSNLLSRNWRFYNNVHFQNISEHLFQYKITSSFLIPGLIQKRLLNQKKTNLLLLPKSICNEFLSLNVNFLDFLLSINQLKLAFSFSIFLTSFALKCQFKSLGIPRIIFDHPKSPVSRGQEIYCQLVKMSFKLQKSNELITIQKKKFFLFNTNYQYLFGFLNPKASYFQLSASKLLENYMFLISNNFFLLNGLYFLINDLVLKSQKRGRGQDFLLPLSSKRMEKNKEAPLIFGELTFYFGGRINNRFQNLCQKTKLLPKMKPVLTCNILKLFASYPFNPLGLKSKKSLFISLKGRENYFSLSKQSVERLKCGQGPHLVSKFKMDKNNFDISLNIINFMGFSILNIYSKDLKSTQLRLTQVLEHLFKYKLIFMLLKHQGSILSKAPVGPKVVTLSKSRNPLTVLPFRVEPSKCLLISHLWDRPYPQRAKGPYKRPFAEALEGYYIVSIPPSGILKKALRWYKCQFDKSHLSSSNGVSLVALTETLIDLPLYVIEKLLKKVYFKKGNTFFTLSLPFQGRLPPKIYSLSKLCLERLK